MANIESKNLLVAVKAYARANALPLDKDEVWESLDAAQLYAQSPTAYAGQTIKVLIGEEYKSYVLQPTIGGLTLKEISGGNQVAYVQIVNELPSEGMAQGVIYIVDGIGYIWNGAEYKKIFQDVQVDLEELRNNKADLSGATFTGKVFLTGETPTDDLEAVTKGYVDSLVNNLASTAPGVVDGGSPLPDSYKAGQTWRVAEVGIYAGQKCEVGDLIICINDGTEGLESDFIIVQANVDGAITGPESAIDANIVVFDGVTGKIIKDSQVSLEALNDTIAKKHWHENKDVLDSYTKTQDTLIAELETEIGTKANANNVYSKNEIDVKVSDLQTSINSKVTMDEVEAQISSMTSDFATTEDINSAINDRVGDIPVDTTVKTYIDNAIGSGGTDSAEAIAQAKQEAIDTSKEYSDSLMTIHTF